jgi:uncharacterized protein YbjT (DUF2867 family)/uncharacterized membrane protein YphA (DoxX/SURF4 family)
MRILLTGSSGFIGQHVLSALLADGHHVVCAVRKAKTSTDPQLTFVEADFAKDTDKSVWVARLAGIDTVINTVGIFRETAGQQFEPLHTQTPRALFAACVESDDVRTVIQLSALGADRNATTRYHLSKKAADDYLASLPLRAYIVQPSLVYGKDGASARAFKMLASLPLAVRFGSAPQLVQPIHVEDVVSAMVALVRHPLPMPASGATAQRIALVGPSAMSFTDYLAALRSAMGMGKLRVLRLAGWLARLLAKAGRFIPGGVLDEDALRMLDRGNTADPAVTQRLIGRPPRPVSEFITDSSAERTRAKLDWLLPLLRLSIAAVWIVTGIVSFGVYPVDESYRLLERTGIGAPYRPLMLYGAATLDLALGLGILLLKRRRWLWLAQIALISFYSVVIAWRLPEFLLHPYGPLTKNLPLLAAIWLLYELEEP